MWVGARGDARALGWTRSFLDEAELADPASPMADGKRVFPRNPLSPVLLHAQASSSSSKPPRAPGARFSRMFLKSTAHPSCIGARDVPRMGYT